MIILPDKNIPRAKFFIPVLKKEWMLPSQAQPKDFLGNENVTKFRVRARLNDGFIVWTGWFDDREDCDAFLWAIANNTLKREKSLWKLSLPEWHPDIGTNLAYEFATITYLTTAGSNQTYTRPSDYNASSNDIQLIAGGGAGGQAGSGTQGRGGGGGGAYTKSINLAIGATATYRVGSGGTNAFPSGTAGGDSWFNGVDAASASVVAKGGSGNSSATGGAGGLAANGVGDVKYNGGTGGNQGSDDGSRGNGGGGGGAAGPNGAGGNGTNGSTSSTNGGDGGTGGNGSGGAGATATGGTGSNGTELGSGSGSGGGGGGGHWGGTAGGPGGLYGAAGGGGGASGGSGGGVGGAGRQGIAVVTYEPFTSSPFFNSPMLGM